jgi:hypothetical protein
MKRIILYPIIPIVLAFNSPAQHLSGPDAIGIGAFTAVTRDVSAIDWNPAGLIFIRDWEMSFNSYLEFRSGSESHGPFLGGSTIGKRFLDTHAFAVRYAPGLTREFSIATAKIFLESAAYDRSPNLLRQQVEYSQIYSAGYAHLFSPMLAVGFSGRLIQQRFTDPVISVDGDTVWVVQNTFDEPLWSFDAGFLYMMSPRITLGLTAKNLISIRERSFPEDFSGFSFNDRKYLRAGIFYSPAEYYSVAADYDTRSHMQVGHIFHLGDYLTFRQGNYLNFERGKTYEAVSGGFGISFGTVDVDLSYLHFIDQTTRGLGTSIQALVEHGIEDIGYNQFTGNRLDMSVRLRLGRIYESLAKIEYVEVISDVYPAAYQVHAYRPIVKVRVRNISQRPIESRVGFFVDRLMERATETRPYYMMPGETVEIPVTAIFSEAIKSIANFTLQTAEVYVRATAAKNYDDRRQTHLAVHGRNDWNGDILMLRYFVTPEDPQILRFTRDILNQHQDDLSEVNPLLERFKKSKILFDRFSDMLIYVHDPRKTHNRVQYPAETLDLRGGDCDDMAVAFSSMLASIGVAAAFVDVVPPEEPHNAHVYLLVDTGIPPEYAYMLSTNPKRYVIRKNEFGDETVWIPLETTVTKEGFDTAWDVGAESYYNEGILQGGLINGWVRIVDVPRI